MANKSSGLTITLIEEMSNNGCEECDIIIIIISICGVSWFQIVATRVDRFQRVHKKCSNVQLGRDSEKAFNEYFRVSYVSPPVVLVQL